MVSTLNIRVKSTLPSLLFLFFLNYGRAFIILWKNIFQKLTQHTSLRMLVDLKSFLNYTILWQHYGNRKSDSSWSKEISPRTCSMRCVLPLSSAISGSSKNSNTRSQAAAMKRYQYGGAAYLIAIIVFTVFGISVQLVNSDLKTDYITIAITSIMIHAS